MDVSHFMLDTVFLVPVKESERKISSPNMNFGPDWGCWKKSMVVCSGTRAYALATLNKRKLIRKNCSESPINLPQLFTFTTALLFTSALLLTFGMLSYILARFFPCARKTEKYRKDNTLFQITSCGSTVGSKIIRALAIILKILLWFDWQFLPFRGCYKQYKT